MLSHGALSSQGLLGAPLPPPLHPANPSLAPFGGEGIRTAMLPGVRCPTCAANGEEVWVIPGRNCGYCRTPAPSEKEITPAHHHSH
ncbi:hypothetical protein B0H63DRAFT_474699 [Podospora didyma]|uniref:Uncharacterized protein n=1 Tax=Podospora didyma TaxID=330526 RepID=A0AAE0TVH4_9PEZI|nr:hypothetical protein B0H63DRAFT_474699 [Podospora didyma]